MTLKQMERETKLRQAESDRDGALDRETDRQRSR